MGRSFQSCHQQGCAGSPVHWNLEWKMDDDDDDVDDDDDDDDVPRVAQW